ncbi:hypothetical protein P3W43_14295 [Salinicola salarius]|uniref:hypothetical protein n=1 Tax=Salinicola salarius TaxID=430457 RepID=UPI0023E43BC7|nr:hypothetical protein [Salinicola salarius]MDF3920028.1 hypothetical protein [Salinicola salarius]
MISGGLVSIIAAFVGGFFVVVSAVLNRKTAIQTMDNADLLKIKDLASKYSDASLEYGVLLGLDQGGNRIDNHEELDIMSPVELIKIMNNCLASLRLELATKEGIGWYTIEGEDKKLFFRHVYFIKKKKLSFIEGLAFRRNKFLRTKRYWAVGAMYSLERCRDLEVNKIIFKKRARRLIYFVENYISVKERELRSMMRLYLLIGFFVAGGIIALSLVTKSVLDVNQVSTTLTLRDGY